MSTYTYKEKLDQGQVKFNECRSSGSLSKKFIANLTKLIARRKFMSLRNHFHFRKHEVVSQNNPEEPKT